MNTQPLSLLQVRPFPFSNLILIWLGCELECQAINMDCLEASIKMKEHLGLNPLVLNMASPKRPGGGKT